VSATDSLTPGSLIHVPDSYLDRLDWAELFPRPQPVEVELGAGDGSFILAWAGAHPGRNFFAVERLLGRLKKIDRKGRRGGLANLRALRLEAAYTIEYLIPPASISALHVYFPDPWPKKRHRHHRLIGGRFPALARQALAPECVVYLRTDDADYFAQMREVFDGAEGFLTVDTPAELAAVTTDFEREFNARGIPTLRAAYRRAG
jgi:tRNA (guanine-N7-)-methyltransferase